MIGGGLSAMRSLETAMEANESREEYRLTEEEKDMLRVERLINSHTIDNVALFEATRAAEKKRLNRKKKIDRRERFRKF